jgi:hypothetical protein
MQRIAVMVCVVVSAIFLCGFGWERQGWKPFSTINSTTCPQTITAYTVPEGSEVLIRELFAQHSSNEEGDNTYVVDLLSRTVGFVVTPGETRQVTFRPGVLYTGPAEIQIHCIGSSGAVERFTLVGWERARG